MTAPKSFLRAFLLVALVFIPLDFLNFHVNSENLVPMYRAPAWVISFDTDSYHRNGDIETVTIHVQHRDFLTVQTWLVDARHSRCALIETDGKKIQHPEWVSASIPMATQEGTK